MRPNEHAKLTGRLVREIKSRNPSMPQKQAFALASKQAAGKAGSGLYNAPRPVGSGVYLTPYYGTSRRR